MPAESTQESQPGAPSSGSGTPPAGSPPSGATPPASTTTTTAGSTGSPSTEQGTRTGAHGTTGTQPPPAPQDDRSNWIPPHRLREETTKRTTLEAEAATLRRQIQALTGATPRDPKTAQSDEIKAAFYELFPHAKSLMELTPEQITRLLTVPDQVAQANSFVNAGWARHGKSMLADLTTEVSQAIGGDLSERAQGRLKSAFTDFIEQEVEKTRQAGDGAPPTPALQRYLDGDKTLVQDFAKEWSEDWITPARRQVTSREVQRGARVPNSSGRAPNPSTVAKPPEFKSLDERLDYAATLYKERGGQFSDR